MITIVDLGIGNVGSIKNMIHKLGKYSIITNRDEDIYNATMLIFPGIGSFDNAITKLNELRIKNVLEEKVLSERIPFLGICLGMQLLAEGSQEGSLPGLGWVNGYVKKFTNSHDLKVPHMGWNNISIKKESKLFTNSFDEDRRFYFVHSYHFDCENEDDVLCTSRYGIEFTSAVQKKNIYATQFHPEKSHTNGIQLLKNFYYI